MRLEKKMATLLVAILIAMMGVMPALAVNPTTNLTVTVEEIISITVDQATLAFGVQAPGVESTPPLTTTVTNAGNVGVYITSELSSTDGSHAWYSVTVDPVVIIPVLGTFEYDVTVTVPVIAPAADDYSATLTFFAGTTPP